MVVGVTLGRFRRPRWLDSGSQSSSVAVWIMQMQLENGAMLSITMPLFWCLWPQSTIHGPVEPRYVNNWWGLLLFCYGQLDLDMDVAVAKCPGR